MKNIDADDPVLAKLPEFTEPMIVSQRPYANFGPLKMLVEAHSMAGALAWSFEYDIAFGDPS